MTELVKEADTYFRDKMKANRDGWRLLECRPMSAMVPDSYRDYFMSLAAMTSAVVLLEEIEKEGNDALLIEFSNRRPKQMLTLEDLDELRDEHVDSEQVTAECDRLEMFLRQSRSDKAKGMEQMKLGNSSAMMYHFAREYAQLMYVKAAFDMLVYLIGGGVVPSVEKISLPKERAQ